MISSLAHFGKQTSLVMGEQGQLDPEWHAEDCAQGYLVPCIFLVTKRRGIPRLQPGLGLALESAPDMLANKLTRITAHQRDLRLKIQQTFQIS
jgi:hypothetical protein